MFQRLNSILEKFFYIKRYFDNEKKWKLFNILGIKFKIRVRQSKDLRTFIANSRLEPLNYVDKTIREKVYISIVAIFKDETDIVDWINYHIKIGVERFYLYDNRCAGSSYERSAWRSFRNPEGTVGSGAVC